MTSFISSFKNSLIAKSVLVFILLFAGYNLALHYFPPKTLYFQSQWERNMSIVEDYVFDDHPKGVVIVGSSMSGRLSMDLLGPRFQNIALSGGSSATGLEVVRRCENKPEMVLVEVNHLVGQDSAFISEQFNPLDLFLRKHFLSARARYKPANLLLEYVKRDEKYRDPRPDSAVFASLFAAQKTYFDQTPDSLDLQRSVVSVKSTVDALIEDHVRVVFFQMPVHPYFENSPRTQISLREFHKAFPMDRYSWIDSLGGDYATTDGVHLLSSSSAVFTKRLRDQVEARFGR